MLAGSCFFIFFLENDFILFPDFLSVNNSWAQSAKRRMKIRAHGMLTKEKSQVERE